MSGFALDTAAGNVGATFTGCYAGVDCGGCSRPDCSSFPGTPGEPGRPGAGRTKRLPLTVAGRHSARSAGPSWPGQTPASFHCSFHWPEGFREDKSFVNDFGLAARAYRSAQGRRDSAGWEPEGRRERLEYAIRCSYRCSYRRGPQGACRAVVGQFCRALGAGFAG